MPKLIKILARTLRYGDKQMGRGGEYTVDDYFAKNCEIEGTAEILKDLGEDETSKLPAKVLDYQFLSKIKQHASEIFEILGAEVKAKIEASTEAARSNSIMQGSAKANDIKREIEANQPPTDSLSKEKIAEDMKDLDQFVEESEKTTETSTSSEKLSPIDELGDLQATEGIVNNVQSILIPKDFPGFTALIKKGITTMEELYGFSYDDLLEKGIRQGTANQIGAKLMELKEKNA